LIKWGIKNPEEDDTLMEDHEVTAAAVSPDGKKLVCAYNDQDTLDFYDFTNKKGVKLEGYNRNSKLVMFSPDGTKIAAPSDTSRLNIWDVTNANSRYELSGNGGIVTAIAFSPDSKEIIFGSSSAWAGKQKGYNLILWDISNLKRGKSQALTGYDNGIKWVAFGDKRIAAFDDKGESLIVWDVSNFEKVIPIALMGKDIIAAALSTDGNKLVLVKMKKLILVDLVTTEEMKLLNHCDFIQAQFIYQLCISAQEKDSIALTSPYEKKIYESLHPKLQQLLQRSLDIKRNAE
jgi:WD40 repeat protein